MAAVSLALNRGQSGFALSDFVVGTSAPTGSADIELRLQLLDANNNPLTRTDIHLAIEAFSRFIKQQGFQSPAGTFPYAPGMGV
jgi:hypothetical protein